MAMIRVVFSLAAFCFFSLKIYISRTVWPTSQTKEMKVFFWKVFLPVICYYYEFNSFYRSCRFESMYFYPIIVEAPAISNGRAHVHHFELWRSVVSTILNWFGDGKEVDRWTVGLAGFNTDLKVYSKCHGKISGNRNLIL